MHWEGSRRSRNRLKGLKSSRELSYPDAGGDPSKSIECRFASSSSETPSESLKESRSCRGSIRARARGSWTMMPPTASQENPAVRCGTGYRKCIRKKKRGKTVPERPSWRHQTEGKRLVDRVMPPTASQENPAALTGYRKWTRQGEGRGKKGPSYLEFSAWGESTVRRKETGKKTDTSKARSQSNHISFRRPGRMRSSKKTIVAKRDGYKWYGNT